MKYILLFFISFNLYSMEKVYKIQVFRNSDGKQLYGLLAKESERAKRLSEARFFHKEGNTTLVNVDITPEIQLKKQKRQVLKVLLKNKDAPVAERLQALIDYLKINRE